MSQFGQDEMNKSEPQKLNVRPEPTGQTTSELADDYKAFDLALKGLGVRIHPSSRFGEFKNQVDKALRATPENFRGLKISEEVFHQAAVEVNQLRVISEELPKIVGGEQATTMLQKLVDGHKLPQFEKKHSDSRDAQFELYLGCHIKRCGISVEFKEPDIIFQFEEKHFGIAAKRPKSLRNLPKVFSDGSNQIEQSGIDGLIGLDISVLFNPKNGRIRVRSQSDITYFLEEKVDEFVEKVSPVVSRSLKSDRTFGMLIYLQAPTIDISEDRLGYAFRLLGTNLCAFEDSRTKILERLTFLLAKPFQNPEDRSDPDQSKNEK